MVKSKQPIAYATVTRSWHGETVVCIAGGPSLTQADVDACRGRARVIVINDGYRVAPWADVLYACDAGWFRWHVDGVAAFAGLKYTITPAARRFADVQVLKDTGEDGLELDPTGLRTGRNSGYQAINLAVHFGASRILLLGYDMKRGNKTHWFGDHPNRQHPPLASFVPFYQRLAPVLKKRGVEVVNCSRETALGCFPRATITDALSLAVAA